MTSFIIQHTWDERKLNHAGAQIRLESLQDSVRMTVDAPYYNDPSSPPAKAGQACPTLWDYEVVEAFFLNDQNQYLEVELCPHGQHLVLMLKGCRDCFQDELPLKFTSMTNGKHWHGEANIPAEYFPPAVTRFNAYSIHGSGSSRQYKALYPVPLDKYEQPDFHRLEYFKAFDQELLPADNHSSHYSSKYWNTTPKSA